MLGQRVVVTEAVVHVSADEADNERFTKGKKKI